MRTLSLILLYLSLFQAAHADSKTSLWNQVATDKLKRTLEDSDKNKMYRVPFLVITNFRDEDYDAENESIGFFHIRFNQQNISFTKSFYRNVIAEMNRLGLEKEESEILEKVYLMYATELDKYERAARNLETAIGPAEEEFMTKDGSILKGIALTPAALIAGMFTVTQSVYYNQYKYFATNKLHKQLRIYIQRLISFHTGDLYEFEHDFL